MKKDQCETGFFRPLVRPPSASVSVSVKCLSVITRTQNIARSEREAEATDEALKSFKEKKEGGREGDRLAPTGCSSASSQLHSMRKTSSKWSGSGKRRAELGSWVAKSEVTSRSLRPFINDECHLGEESGSADGGDGGGGGGGGDDDGDASSVARPPPRVASVLLRQRFHEYRGERRRPAELAHVRQERGLISDCTYLMSAKRRSNTAICYSFSIAQG